MSKTNFSLDLLRRNEQNNPEKMIGAHVPIKKSPHTGTLLILMELNFCLMMKDG